jgi:hypothetical protein
MAQQPPVGQGPLIIEASRSHSRTLSSVRLLWTNDQPDAETSTCTTHSTQKRYTFMPQARFEPTTLASERLQTHALDRKATGIGLSPLLLRSASLHKYHHISLVFQNLFIFICVSFSSL